MNSPFFNLFKIILGTIFIILGLYRFFYLAPDVGVNLLAQQPLMINGTDLILIGIILIAFGFFGKRKNDKTLNKNHRIKKWLKHY